MLSVKLSHLPTRPSTLLSPLATQTAAGSSPFNVPTGRCLPTPPMPSDIRGDFKSAPEQPNNLTVADRHLQGHALDMSFSLKYSIQQELGSGGFGFVCSALRRCDNVLMAVKFILKSHMSHSSWAIDKDLGRIPLEVYILKNIRHPNIIRFVDYFEDSAFVYLVTEMHGSSWSNEGSYYLPSPVSSPFSDAAFATEISTQIPTLPQSIASCPSMDLFECIEKHEHFTEYQAQFVFRQILSAIHHLHSFKLVHRDIKDENILIDESFHIKIIDFGSANFFDAPGGKQFDRFLGTIQYAAPEILKAKKYRGPEAEIWALGCCLYIMLTGQVPFASAKQAVQSTYSEPQIRLSSKCISLLNSMLHKDPALRMSIEEVMMHPWIIEQL